ncbi:MAG: 3-isopropylmalate dehydratase large subunit [Bacteroidales bacterium]
MEQKTLFDKVWDTHVVESIKDGPEIVYIDRHFIHEVTSPVAFLGLKKRGLTVARPTKTTATPDHNVPTIGQDKPIADLLSRDQVETLENNCKEYGIEYKGLGNEEHGIVHVIGPELGYTQPGMTIVCGDSHTSTHGAFGCVSFGIGTSEVEMVLATQCILQPKPKTMRIEINGKLGKFVTAKDIALYVISKLTTGGATGYFIEFSGDTIKALSMEGRMTLCNMSIECGARGGIIAPDETTFAYLKDRKHAPQGADWNEAIAKWRKLPSDTNAVYDKEVIFKAKDIKPMITFGTNPGLGISIDNNIPEKVNSKDVISFEKSLAYMNFQYGDKLEGKPVDYVFLGSCTNGRIEDFRAFAEFVEGKKKADNITAWLVPGSKSVERQITEEGLDNILEEAGFTLRQPGCSACLAMNDDKIPASKYSVSTSNRNFEGRQGPNSRTLLASPYTAAACAVSGKIANPQNFN